MQSIRTLDQDRAISELLDRHPRLEPIIPKLQAAYEVMAGALEAGGTVYLAGNGGSAADCEHFAAELLKGFESPRPLPGEMRDRLPAPLADALQGGLRAVPLTGFLGLRSAMANDVPGPWEFAQLVLALGRPGDVLCCLTTSGNSQNLVQAAHAAKASGMKVVGLTGRDGGTLATLCDVELRAPADRTIDAQELHLPLYHTLALLLEHRFFAE